MLKRCPVCDKEFKTPPSRNKRCCSRECMSVFQRGENNPNFGNQWTNKQRIHQSDIMKSKVNDDFRYKVGSANRGKKFSEERCKNISEGHKGIKREPMSEECKKKIGLKSKEKWTDEYKENFRRQMEDGGFWIPLEEKDDSKIYFEESNWIDKMFDIVDDGKDLLLEFGVFNIIENKKGVVRDHRYGRISGFKNGVFPEILRHPANCQIILHSENVSKAQLNRGKERQDSSISLEELFEEIKSYQKEWKEQDLVLELIKEYESGKRSNKKGG